MVLRAIGIGGTMLALAGCSALDYTLAKTDYQDCQWLRVFALQPACHEYKAPEAASPTADGPLYCYRTLGDVECQSGPSEGRTLVGSG